MNRHEKWGKPIERGTVKPKEIETTPKIEIPDEWKGEVDVSEGALERSREIAEKRLRASARRGRLRGMVFLAVDVAESYIPEALKPLTNRIKESLMPVKRIKEKIENRFSLKLDSTREAIALVISLILLAVFKVNMEAAIISEVISNISAGVGALIIAYYTVKNAFKNETEDEE